MILKSRLERVVTLKVPTSRFLTFLDIYNTKQLDVCPSVCPSLKISVTTEPIGFYSSGNIPTGRVVVLGYFLGGGTHPTPQKQNKKITNLANFAILRKFAIYSRFFFSLGKKENLLFIRIFFCWAGNRRCNYILWAKPLVARGDAASGY